MQKLHKPKDWRWLLHRALSIVFSRTVVTVVLVLAQAVWLFSVFTGGATTRTASPAWGSPSAR